jgi:5'-nucleotidase
VRSRTLVLAITTVLLVGAGPAQAHGGGHHHHGQHHKRHKPRAVDVQLLSINDFHGNIAPPGTITLPPAVPPETLGGRINAGGAEYLATKLNALRAQNPNTLVVSAGDNIGASPLVSGLFHDEPTIEAFNAMGVDISAVGNHEFDEGSSELLRMQDGGCHPLDGCQDGDGFAGADFDYLSANVVDDDSGRTLFRPYEIRRVGGVKIGFIGVVLKDTPTIVTPSGVEGLTFGDEADAIDKYTAILKKKGVRAIVVLMHQGDTVDFGGRNECKNPVGPLADIIGRSSKEVDLYLTGHTHSLYNCVIAGKRATSASSFGRAVTDANLRIDRRTGQVVSVSADNQIVTQDVAKDPAQSTILNKYTAISAPIANKRIGTSTAALTRDQNPAGESVLGDIIADSQLADTASAITGNAVVAFMNPGGIRTDIDAGDITFADAFAVQPFGNSLVTMTLTGAQIDRALEQQWDGQGTTPKVLQVSGGFTYTWSASGPLGSRVDPSTIKINGTTVDPAASYRVTVNSFLADGGDGFTILKSGTDRLGGDVDVDALGKYLGAHDPIAPTPRDRITQVP